MNCKKYEDNVKLIKIKMIFGVNDFFLGEWVTEHFDSIVSLKGSRLGPGLLMAAYNQKRIKKIFEIRRLIDSN